MTYETPAPVTEVCPHGLANVSYHPCRFCLEERLDEILKLLKAKK